MKPPLLTICLLCHNSEKYIEKTLESLLSQTYPNFEILVSDNQSVDRTLEIVKDFQKRDSRIVLRKNALDIKPDRFYDGCYSNCNGCINSDLIRGEFVSFCHSDDTYEKDIAKEEIEFLTKNPGAGAVFTRVNIIDKNSTVIGASKFPKELWGKDVYSFIEIFKSLLKHGNNFIITPTFMTRKNVLDDVGLFSYEKTFKTSADLEMWLRIAEKYPIGILNKKLASYRTNGEGRAQHHLRKERADFFATMDYYLEKTKTRIKIEDAILRQYECQKYFDDTLLAMNFLIKNDLQSVKKLINKKLPLSVLVAIFENITLLRIKVFSLRLIMLLCVNIGLGGPLGRLLSRV